MHEHTFNVALGEVLQTRRGSWKNCVATERNGGIEGGGRADNLIYPYDMQPVAVEAAFVGDPDIDGDAVSRLGKTETVNGREIMTVAALAIPESVRKHKTAAAVREWLQDGGELEYALYSMTRGKNGEIPEKGYDIRYPDGEPNSGYLRGTAADLADLIELAATPDKKIKQAAEHAGGVVRGIAASMYDGVREKTRQQIAEKVGQPADIHAMRVAVCVWLNAMSLHGKLAAARDEIQSPRECKNLRETAAAWREILEIDYNSVFLPALESLELLSDYGALANDILTRLKKEASALNDLHLGAVADVSSDMFPELATDRKTTAAYYTKMEVAELLAGMAFNLIPDDGRELKIADFACGTGALLKAAYRQVRRRAEGRKQNMRKLHKRYMEKCLHGADIQPVAAHLTAAGLAGMHPAADYAHSNIICSDIRRGKTGSLDLLKNEAIEDLFGVSSFTATDGSKTHNFRPADGTFDLCIMNPPYSRTRGESKTRGGGKVFGVEGLPQYQREKSLDNLGKLLSGSFANKKAGMASAFCLLADKKLKPGGVLAAVLPLSAAGQHSWRDFRAHIIKNYSDIIVVSMATEKMQSFSAETEMGEMLICARKGGKTGGQITFLNLLNFPRTFVETNEMARTARFALPPYTMESGDVSVGAHVFASCFITKHSGESWGAVGAKSAEMAYIGQMMTKGKIFKPGLIVESAVTPKISALSSCVSIGPSHDHIGHPSGGDGRGAFVFRKVRRGDNSNFSLWAANHKTQQRLICEPTHRGEVAWIKHSLVARFMHLKKIGEEDALKKMKAFAAEMHKKRSVLFVSRSLRLTSQSLVAAMTAEPCMGGRAWTAIILPDSKMCAAYCLWFNSLPGLIARWQCGGRQHPGRAQMQINDIGAMPCPAFSGKEAGAGRAVKIAGGEFVRLAELDLMPCSYAWRDDSRKEIDRVVLRMIGLDEKITESDMQALREEWCREPSVHGGNKTILKALHADGLL